MQREKLRLVVTFRNVFINENDEKKLFLGKNQVFFSQMRKMSFPSKKA